MLQGPDPDLFRISVNNARWYCDPLPACDIAPATEDRWPSVTTIKKAWSKPFRKRLPTGETVPLDAYRAAEFTLDRLPAITALADDPLAAITLISTSAGRFLNKAANRGTGVHEILETLAAGQTVDELTLDPTVATFLPACEAFVTDWSPTWVAAEVIAVNRTIGYAGTADAIVSLNVDGKPWVCLVDWKTRGGDHGAYEEEIAQIGGYSLAEYLIAKSPIDGTPIRVPSPHLDAGLIVSINSSGYLPYPVDLDEARAAFKAMHVSWVQHREGQAAARRGRRNPLIATSTRGNGDQPAAGSDAGDTSSESEPATGPTLALPALTARIDWLRTRIRALPPAARDEAARMWPDGVPRKADDLTSHDQVDRIVACLWDIEGAHGVPFPDPDPSDETEATPPREEPPVASGPNPIDQSVDWADRGKALLALLDDEPLARACAAVAGCDTKRMTERDHLALTAVVTQVSDPAGAIQAAWHGPDPDIICHPQAAQILAQAHGGTKQTALTAAKAYARAFGLDIPRSLADAASNPLLAALVATRANTPNTQETQ